MDKLEYRAVIRFLFLQGKSPKTIHGEMHAVYDQDCPSYSVIAEWYRHFKCGRTSIRDEERTGRPSTAVNDEMIKKVESLIKEDRLVSINEICQEVKLSVGSVETIIHDHLHMSKLSARWIPRLLTPFQKQQRVQCSQQLLDLDNKDKDMFFSRVATMDESWVHHYDPESKESSKQWKHCDSPPPKKAKVQASAKKVMLSVFWDERGVIMTDYLPKGHTITGAYYADLLEKLRDKIKTCRRGMISKGVLLLHDNAPAHSSYLALMKARQCGYVILAHPPYSPDLAPSDFFLFPNLKRFLKGKHFQDDNSVISATESWLTEQSATFYKEGIRKCLHRWEKCIAVDGEYVEST